MSHRLLLVEDEPDIREPLRELLQDEGFEVRTANNGQDALDTLARDPLPGIIIADLLMPVMNGIELLEKLRADPRLAAIPIVFLSASSTVAPPAGVRMVRKPVALDRLLAIIREHFPAE